MNNESKNAYTTAIILAAGTGSRLNFQVPKQRVMLRGKSLIARATEAFLKCYDVDNIVVVTRAEDLDFVKKELRFAKEKLYAVVEGGNCRAESAKCGFLAVPPCTTHVAIHDGARCLVATDDITSVIREGIRSGAASAVSRINDTVKEIYKGKIYKTLPRDALYLAETPQVFCVDAYQGALLAAEDLCSITDDNMLLERMGVSITPVVLKESNPKITYANDLDYAEFLLERKEKNEKL